ncbi:TonB-dependent receptor plug domain-containing protein [Bacteroidota bacterium]
MKRKILSILLISLGVTTYAQLEKSTIDLKEVVVSASRSITQLKNIPQKIEVITKEEIQGIPADNVAEILKRTANLDIIQYPGLSATIGLRGFSPNTLGNSSYVLILINGKPSGTQNLASIDMNMVEKIELVKGPYASLYGSQAMGGVVNIITKIPSEKASGSFSYSFGSFGNSTLSASASMAINDKINVRLGYNSKQQSKDYRIGSKNLLIF